MIDSAYLSQPTLQGDALVFVSDDDLWRAGSAGGRAQRLTAGLGEVSAPCLSPDGRWLAYIGRDEQHAEVWLMPAEGGPARRLTWLAADTAVRGWTPDGRILFVSTWGQPFVRHYHAFTLDPAGGMLEPLNLGPVNHLAFGPGGACVIGRNTADPARWKRYRGGTAGHLWIDAAGDGRFRRMHELAGNLSCPMWLGGRVYFLSDGEGIGNLYSCRPDGSDARRHTDHADYYARHAQTDGRRIVYQCGARLWLYDPAAQASRPIELQVPSPRMQAARRFVPADEHLAAARLHPEGHSVALDVRGKLYTMALWEGGVRQHGAADRRALSPRPVACRRRDAARGQRRVGRGADRAARGRRARARRRPGPRAADAGSARGHALRARQPPQRADRRRRRRRQPVRRRPQRCRLLRGSGLVGRRQLAGLQLPDRRASARSSCMSRPRGVAHW